MKIQSILAIYVLFWTLCLFVVLPMGVRTTDELGEARVAGQADSAPHRFSLGKAAIRATILSALLFGLFYANYVFGWVGVEALNWLPGV
jgi:predicted secreted protein